MMTNYQTQTIMKYPIALIILKQIVGSFFPPELVQLIMIHLYDISEILIGAGDEHSIIICESKTNLFGSNEYGALDLNTPLDKLDDIVKIKCGGDHTLLLSKSGKVYGCGLNSYYQVHNKINYKKHVNELIQFDICAKIIDISAGRFFSMAIDIDDNVYAWGDDSYGQLGSGGGRGCLPITKYTFKNILSVSCGGYHTLFVTKLGELYSVGDNLHGQLGLADNVRRIIPEKINLPHIVGSSCSRYGSCALTKTGLVYYWGKQMFSGTSDTIFIPTRIDIQNVVSISSGIFFGIALCMDHSLYYWGRISGRDSLTTIPTKINLFPLRSVYCGGSHIIATTLTNEIFGLGSNSSNQLNNEYCDRYSNPIKLAMYV